MPLSQQPDTSLSGIASELRHLQAANKYTPINKRAPSLDASWKKITLLLAPVCWNERQPTQLETSAFEQMNASLTNVQFNRGGGS